MKNTLLLLALSTGLSFAGELPPPPAPTSVPPPPEPAKAGSSFNYNYLELDWIHNDIDIIGEGDGYGVGLSLSPVEHLIIFANWGQTWGDVADFRSLVGGAGAYLPLCAEADLVVKAGYQWADADVVETVTVDENAFVASIGFRIALTDWLEFAPAYIYQLADGDSYHTAAGSLLFDIGTDVQLSINGSVDDNQTSFGAGIRYNF